MIEKLGLFSGEVSPTDMKLATKINELVDAVNELMMAKSASVVGNDETPAENVQKNTKSRPENVQDPVCFISTTYLSDNQTTVFLGQKGASVEFNQPLPAGFMITIKEN